METFVDVGSVARDARCRVQRVAIFFEALFVLTGVGLFALDRIPPRPHLECVTSEGMTMSHYPHPYGEPPTAQWTRCNWRE